MNINTYINYYIEWSTGTTAGSIDADWQRGVSYDSLDGAREFLANCIGDMLDGEDRGDYFLNEWEQLSERAKNAEVDEPLTFDEHSWRIVKVFEREIFTCEVEDAVVGYITGGCPAYALIEERLTADIGEEFAAEVVQQIVLLANAHEEQLNALPDENGDGGDPAALIALSDEQNDEAHELAVELADKVESALADRP